MDEFPRLLKWRGAAIVRWEGFVAAGLYNGVARDRDGYPIIRLDRPRNRHEMYELAAAVGLMDVGDRRKPFVGSVDVRIDRRPRIYSYSSGCLDPARIDWYPDSL